MYAKPGDSVFDLERSHGGNMGGLVRYVKLLIQGITAKHPLQRGCQREGAGVDVTLAILSELTHKRGLGGVMRYFAASGGLGGVMRYFAASGGLGGVMRYFAANGKSTIHLIPILPASGLPIYFDGCIY